MARALRIATRKSPLALWQAEHVKAALGELYPELLFSDDPGESKRVTLHPAILWKLLNVRAHLAKGKT